jgi:hypothetical protein
MEARKPVAWATTSGGPSPPSSYAAISTPSALVVVHDGHVGVKLGAIGVVLANGTGSPSADRRR